MIATPDWEIGGGILDVSSRGDGAPTAANPRREYASAGDQFRSTRDILEEEGLGCGPLAWHGIEEYRRMDRCPAVGASFNALRAAVLSGPIGLLPAIKSKGSQIQAGQIPGENLEADMAAEIAESNRRTMDSWDTPAPLVLWEAMEAMKFGHMVAERVMADVSGGPDDGLLAIRSLRWLPRSSYRFKVDRAMNVVGITISTIKADHLAGWRLMEPEHFPHLTWDAHRNDPRGRSMYRMARHAWRMLERLWPEVEKGWHQFGTPYLWGTLAPGSQNLTVPPADSQGKPIPGGKPVTHQHSMLMAINSMRNGAAAVGPSGSDLKLIESQKDSTMVSNAINILKSEIVLALLLQLRATMEAQHGSKADSQTGQDIMGTLIRFVRMWLERWLRRVLMGQNAINYGEDIARRLTPIVNLGEHEHQDFAAEVGAFAALFQANYCGRSQLPYFDEKFGFPQREPGEPRVGPNGLVFDEPPAPAQAQPATEPEPEPDAAEPATKPDGGGTP